MELSSFKVVRLHFQGQYVPPKFEDSTSPLTKMQENNHYSCWVDKDKIFQGQCYTVDPPCATTSHKRPPIPNIQIFPVKALQLEPL